MTINPNRSTAPIGDLAASGADRLPLEALRRSRAASPYAHAAPAREAEEVAGVTGENLPTEREARIPVLSARQLSIQQDPEVDRVVVRVIDAETGEVVRQIPSEEFMRHLKRLKGAKGLFVDQEG
ncbi:MAG: flagellar protein FlaG [Deltaproteobacteria bacterium]|nr:flagellar protein FlaG [Deltaproteobacteria bacterium]